MKNSMSRDTTECYDTLEPEQNLDDVEEVMAQVLQSWDHNEVMCSYKLNQAIGAHIGEACKKISGGILKSAYENGVPVFVPAFTDSELGAGHRHSTTDCANLPAGTECASILSKISNTRSHLVAAEEAVGNLHHRGRRAPELVATVWPVHRAAAPAPG